jgi:hypothetical protein
MSDRRNPAHRPRTVRDEGEQGSHVTTYLPEDEHDELIRLSNRRGQSQSATVRAAIRRYLRDHQSA